MPLQPASASEPAASSGPQPVFGIADVGFGSDGGFVSDGGFGTGPRSVTGAPFAGATETFTGGREKAEFAEAPLTASSPFSWETAAPANGEVIVPPAESLAEENRLPIFEAVESDWFRHGRNAFGRSGDAEETETETETGWASPADEGWRAAAAVPTPSSGGLTPAGLPKRVPQANLVPGAAASTRTQTPARSAAATRERFASFQRGVKEGRAAASTGASPAQDETS